MRDEIKHVTQQFIEANFSESEVVWIGGSAAKGNLTKESDIDLVIIDEAETPRLQCYEFQGWKIEAFIYTALSLELQFQAARYRGIPTIIRMCADGLLIKDERGTGKEVTERAVSLFEQGPERWSEGRIGEAKYQITDHLSDFRSSEDFEESVFILNKLVSTLAEMVLKAEGKWTGEGKWFARELRSYDHELSGKLVSSSRHFMQTEDKNELISLIHSVLDQYGGELFEGHREFLQ
ncbi:nucleotidyltransferase domain-containing protein [Bacillus salacetis]|uniref:Nucleotidyltransferase domain-containing protein n=1 Tax=Bacillus salacetis TaxID=2315464 RepID=A0A3A1QNS2_9BACI|nr:nucleotidyltransferase domain-containing protein [Bacillus salacetis]RIW28690.1 nucleotidyltransferase domain-containing protein [Bacillus salacetis]